MANSDTGNLGWKKAQQLEDDELVRRGRDAAPQNRIGLAISGGGIRSATFALGVLEGLKQRNRLESIAYLSTVSGGGYIGGWLSASCRRHLGWLTPAANWNDSITHLRRYSNYLSPKVGFFSADTWTMATIWLRNTLLVQVTVVLAMACVLMLPRPLFALFQDWPFAGELRWLTIILFVFGAVGIAGNQIRMAGHPRLLAFLRGDGWIPFGAVAAAWFGAAALYAQWTHFEPFRGGAIRPVDAGLIALSLVVGTFCLQPLAVKVTALIYPWFKKPAPTEVNYTQGWAQGAVVIPLMVAGFLVTAILWAESAGPIRASAGGEDILVLSTLSTYGSFFLTAGRYWPFPLSVVFVSLVLLSLSSVQWSTAGVGRGSAVALLAAAVGIVVLHALLCAVMVLLHPWAIQHDTFKAFVWGPPLVAGSFVLTICVLIGILSRQSTEGAREWWSRLGAWLGIYATAWMVITVAAVYSHTWVTWLATCGPAAMAAGGGWIGTTLAGLLAGNSQSTSGAPKSKSTFARVKEVAVSIAPLLFILGLMVAVAVVLDVMVTLNAEQTWDSAANPGGLLLTSPFTTVSAVVLIGCVAALLLVAWRVDINEFGLNAFYRHRLVRCYLGATRFAAGERHPQNFTGFDDDDDLPLAALAGGSQAGPLHIVNCALNLGGSSDLALHTRHSASFTLTPLTCGSAYESRTQSGLVSELGFIPTDQYGGRAGAPTLGQAIAVSGAAASPNMGYHTSPLVAFLLTVFNLRLGWWFPSPLGSKTGRPSPLFNLSGLVAELFGGANDTSSFLMVSDGGHFENLAAYELVRRRCGTIIISDAECDPALSFEGLGTLIRMCEVDFGVTIDIDVTRIRTRSDLGWSTNRCATGTIVWGDGSPDGKLVYLKASMKGNESTPVMQYKASHATFPHEGTGDQFYTEDQFESYRHLGQAVALEAFAAPS